VTGIVSLMLLPKKHFHFHCCWNWKTFVKFQVQFWAFSTAHYCKSSQPRHSDQQAGWYLHESNYGTCFNQRLKPVLTLVVTREFNFNGPCPSGYHYAFEPTGLAKRIKQKISTYWCANKRFRQRGGFSTLLVNLPIVDYRKEPILILVN